MFKLKLFGFLAEIRIRRAKGLEALPARNRRLVRDIRRGMDREAVTAKYHIGLNRLLQILEETGERPRKWKKMPPARRVEICRAFQAGKSKAEIGRMFGVSRERVRQIVQERE